MEGKAFPWLQPWAALATSPILATPSPLHPSTLWDASSFLTSCWRYLLLQQLETLEQRGAMAMSAGLGLETALQVSVRH